MSEQHSQEEILSLTEKVEVAAVASSAGDSTRNRMMRHTSDENFNIYLATLLSGSTWL